MGNAPKEPPDWREVRQVMGEFWFDEEALAKEVIRLRHRLRDFLTYYEPDAVGISQVPLGPFERAKDSLPLTLG